MVDVDVQVTLSRGAIDRIANTPEVGQAMVTAGERGVAFVRREAPVRSGAYRDSVTVEAVDVTVGGRTRKGARVAATDPKAQHVEWANGTHLLARAVDVVERGR